MGELLHGWRRKIGVVTLGLACLFLGMWVRSYLHVDMLKLPMSEPSLSWLTSSNGVIDWTTTAPIDPDSTVMGTPEKIDLMSQMITQMITSGVEGHGVVFDVRTETLRSTAWRIPYWSVILALALISVVLLVAKPKISTQKKTQEPIRNS